MKYVKLLGTAYVNGVSRHPSEGILHLTDDEANRLIEEKLGEDVSSDFDSVADEQVPVEHITTVTGGAPSKEKGK